MGKFQFGCILFVITLSGLNSLQTLEELKNSLANLQMKNLKKLESLAPKHKKLPKIVVTPPLSENIDDNNEDNSSSDENTIQPCTCAIFLSGQFKKRSPPTGSPALLQEQDNAFQCTPLGIKQCQTKCVETIIKHLPNSAKIICATVDRDINKEKAYLFVQNCNKTWHNTNLSSGKQFCCKDNSPATCPIIL